MSCKIKAKLDIELDQAIHSNRDRYTLNDQDLK